MGQSRLNKSMTIGKTTITATIFRCPGGVYVGAKAEEKGKPGLALGLPLETDEEIKGAYGVIIEEMKERGLVNEWGY